MKLVLCIFVLLVTRLLGATVLPSAAIPSGPFQLEADDGNTEQVKFGNLDGAELQTKISALRLSAGAESSVYFGSPSAPDHASVPVFDTPPAVVQDKPDALLQNKEAKKPADAKFEKKDRNLAVHLQAKDVLNALMSQLTPSKSPSISKKPKAHPKLSRSPVSGLKLQHNGFTKQFLEMDERIRSKAGIRSAARSRFTAGVSADIVDYFGPHNMNWRAWNGNIAPPVSEGPNAFTLQLLAPSAPGKPAALKLSCNGCGGEMGERDYEGRWTVEIRTLPTVGAANAQRQCFVVELSGRAQRFVFCPEDENLCRKWLEKLQTTVWVTTDAPLDNKPPGKVAATDPIPENRPGWVSLPLDETGTKDLFGYSFEVEGSSRTILQYYKPKGVRVGVWRDLAQFQRETIVDCFLYNDPLKPFASWHREPTPDCHAKMSRARIPKPAQDDILQALTPEDPDASVNWESFELCEYDQRAHARCMDHRKADFAPRVRAAGIASCSGVAAEAVWHTFLPQSPYQEAGDVTWELAQRDYSTDLAHTTAMIKCVREMMWDIRRAHLPYPTSNHIHVSFRPPADREQARHVASYVIWLNDVFTASIVRRGTYLMHRFFSAPPSLEVTDLFANQLTNGYMSVEHNIAGTNWGNFKNGYIALRHGPYGPSRWGIEFRVGDQLPEHYAAIAGVPVDNWFPPNPVPLQEMHQRVEDTIGIIKHLLDPLKQRNFDGTAPVRVLGHTRPPTEVHSHYSIGSLFPILTANRQVWSCIDDTDAKTMDREAALGVTECGIQSTNIQAARACVKAMALEERYPRFFRKITLAAWSHWDRIDLGHGTQIVPAAEWATLRTEIDRELQECGAAVIAPGPNPPAKIAAAAAGKIAAIIEGRVLNRESLREFLWRRV